PDRRGGREPPAPPAGQASDLDRARAALARGGLRPCRSPERQPTRPRSSERVRLADNKSGSLRKCARTVPLSPRAVTAWGLLFCPPSHREVAPDDSRLAPVLPAARWDGRGPARARPSSSSPNTGVGPACRGPEQSPLGRRRLPRQTKTPATSGGWS